MPLDLTYHNYVHECEQMTHTLKPLDSIIGGMTIRNEGKHFHGTFESKYSKWHPLCQNSQQSEQLPPNKILILAFRTIMLE